MPRGRRHHPAHDRDAQDVAELPRAEMTALATPACDGGIPLTPAFVIGGLTRPWPAPSSMNATACVVGDVDADIPRSTAAPVLFCFPPRAARGTEAAYRDDGGQPSRRHPAGSAWMPLLGGTGGPLRLIDLGDAVPHPWVGYRQEQARKRQEAAERETHSVPRRRGDRNRLIGITLHSPLECPACDRKFKGTWVPGGTTADQACPSCGHVFTATWPDWGLGPEQATPRVAALRRVPRPPSAHDARPSTCARQARSSHWRRSQCREQFTQSPARYHRGHPGLRPDLDGTYARLWQHQSGGFLDEENGSPGCSQQPPAGTYPVCAATGRSFPHLWLGWRVAPRSFYCHLYVSRRCSAVGFSPNSVITLHMRSIMASFSSPGSFPNVFSSNWAVLTQVDPGAYAATCSPTALMIPLLSRLLIFSGASSRRYAKAIVGSSRNKSRTVIT